MRAGLIISLIALAIITTIIYLKYQQAMDENLRWATHVSDLRALAGIGELGSTHEHLAVLLVVNEKPLDLSQQRYQLRSRFVHLEDGVGGVIHKHATGITVVQFLSTLRIDLSRQCLTLDSGKSYCTTKSKQVRMFVNGEPLTDLGMYELMDGDDVLLIYGEEEEDVSKYLNELSMIKQEHREHYFEHEAKQTLSENEH